MFYPPPPLYEECGQLIFSPAQLGNCSTFCMKCISHTEKCIYYSLCYVSYVFLRKYIFIITEISEIVMEPVYYYNSMTFFRLAFPLTIFLNEFLGSMWFLLPLAKYFAQFDLVYFFSTFEYENCQTENLKYLHNEYPDNYHVNSAIANILLYLLYLISYICPSLYPSIYQSILLFDAFYPYTHQHAYLFLEFNVCFQTFYS